MFLSLSHYWDFLAFNFDGVIRRVSDGVAEVGWVGARGDLSVHEDDMSRVCVCVCVRVCVLVCMSAYVGGGGGVYSELSHLSILLLQPLCWWSGVLSGRLAKQL